MPRLRLITPKLEEPDADSAAASDADAKAPQEPITRRPDGYYWAAPDGKQSFGPFESYEDALADLHSGDPDDLEPGESLQEAESEIGIAQWIDPETGEPAEGLAPPHLDPD